MTTLQRSRSLRKPTTTTTHNGPPPPLEASAASTQNRNASPSRLPTTAVKGASSSMRPRVKTGPSTSSATASTSTRSDATRATAASRPMSRPPSGSSARASSQNGRTVRVPSSSTAVDREKNGRYYPPSASAGRHAATTASGAAVVEKARSRPASSHGGTNEQRRVLSHTRAKSTVAPATSAQNPPSLTESSSRNKGGKTHGAAGATRTGHARGASASVVSKVAAGNAGAVPTASRRLSSSSPSDGAASGETKASKATAGALSAAAPKLRPAFSTLQQHYSPAKSTAAKPLTSAILAPPSPSKLPANVAASAEISRLQTELLQLHLLHRDAAAVEAQWRASARENLGRRFSQLRKGSQEVEEQERERGEWLNASALKAWAREAAPAAGRMGLDEKVQGLDAIMTGLWGLTDAGGKYARLVRRFERWIDGVCEIEEDRKRQQAHDACDSDDESGGRRRTGGSHMLGECKFVEDLDATWKDDLAGISRKVEEWQARLREIGGSPDTAGGRGFTSFSKQKGGKEEQVQSSLSIMLVAAGNLLDDMLAEMTIMEELESEALAREENWVQKMSRSEAEDDEGGRRKTATAGAIWRMV